jgi:L-lactate dehydrogenase complex protein LldF
MTTELRTRIGTALGQDRVRANIRRAMDGLVIKRRKAFPDEGELKRLRDQGAAIRASALANLPDVLEELDRNCTANGIQVHWAEDAAQGNGIVGDILRRHGATLLIKGKSMVSEEMGLNAYLEGQGVEVVETDLGEFIIQHAGESPSHIVAPAVHKDRHEVAALFRSEFPAELPAGPEGEAIESLTAAARRLLRAKFREARAGLSGVNFAVAETGTLCLVENEGNGRMCTTVPEVHIAVMGIEKVVPRLDQIPPLLTLLTRSATGQPITTYFNMISSPRRPGEKDGPKEVHLVLLDNGRSRIYADPELRDGLRCIRCEACMNHCPVYVRLGGHAYGTVYPGPIGTVIEPQLQGIASQGELASASTLCGACAEVCPVRIPLPSLINRLRYEGVRRVAVPGAAGVLQRGARRNPLEALVWRLWAWLHANPALYRGATGLAARLRWLQPELLGPWTRTRAVPRLAAKGLHRLALEEGFEDGPGPAWERRPAAMGPLVAVAGKHGVPLGGYSSGSVAARAPLPQASFQPAPLGQGAGRSVLGRLRAGRPQVPEPPVAIPVRQFDWTPAERLARFRERLVAVRGEVHLVGPDWRHYLFTLLSDKGVRTLLHGDPCPLGTLSEPGWPDQKAVRLIAYQQPVEDWRDGLFGEVDAALSTCRGAVAETGTLVLRPTPEEPRLLSLVPPIHVCLLDAAFIYSTFAELAAAQGWARGMPTNALLVTGPSKSADIEQTLTYGVHGPKELIVLVLAPGEAPD